MYLDPIKALGDLERKLKDYTLQWTPTLHSIRSEFNDVFYLEECFTKLVNTRIEDTESEWDPFRESYYNEVISPWSESTSLIYDFKIEDRGYDILNHIRILNGCIYYKSVNDMIRLLSKPKVGKTMDYNEE